MSSNEMGDRVGTELKGDQSILLFKLFILFNNRIGCLLFCQSAGDSI